MNGFSRRIKGLETATCGDARPSLAWQAIKSRAQERGWSLEAPQRSAVAPALTLAGLEAGIGLVNDVNTTAAAHYAAILVTQLGRFQRTKNFHDLSPALIGN